MVQYCLALVMVFVVCCVEQSPKTFHMHHRPCLRVEDEAPSCEPTCPWNISLSNLASDMWPKLSLVSTRSLGAGSIGHPCILDYSWYYAKANRSRSIMELSRTLCVSTKVAHSTVCTQAKAKEKVSENTIYMYCIYRCIFILCTCVRGGLLCWDTLGHS